MINKNHKFVKLIIVLLTTLATLIIMLLITNKYLYRSKASQIPVDVYLNPLQKSVGLNETFKVSVFLALPDTENFESAISAAYLTIKYDPQILRFSYLEKSADCNLLEKQVFLRQNQSRGEVSLAKVSLKRKEELPRAVFCFAQLSFTAVKSGTAQINIVPQNQKEINIVGPGPTTYSLNLSAKSVVNIKVDENNLTLTDASGNNLIIKFKLQGISSTTRTNKTKISVTIYNSANEPTEFKNVIATFNPLGFFVAKVPLGQLSGTGYSIALKGPYHLQKKFCELETKVSLSGSYSCNKGDITLQPGNNNAYFDKLALPVGDLTPQDGLLTTKDVVILEDCLENNDSSCITTTDVNYDGKVDIKDKELLINNMRNEYEDVR